MSCWPFLLIFRLVQIVLATLGLYGGIIGIAVLNSKLKTVEKVAPEVPDYHTGDDVVWPVTVGSSPPLCLPRRASQACLVALVHVYSFHFIVYGTWSYGRC